VNLFIRDPLVRDPRDVARSNNDMGWSGNVWTGVDRWIEAEYLWERVKEKLEKGTSYIAVRYEQLIVSPEDTLSAICNFMKINYDPKMMSYPEYTTYSKPDTNLIDQWKRKLTKREIELVECKARRLMGKRGYKLVSKKIDTPSYTKKIILRIHDKQFRIRFRINRFGWRLVFLDFFARRFKLRKLERKIKLELHEITKKYLK